MCYFEKNSYFNWKNRQPCTTHQCFRFLLSDLIPEKSPFFLGKKSSFIFLAHQKKKNGCTYFQLINTENSSYEQIELKSKIRQTTHLFLPHVWPWKTHKIKLNVCSFTSLSLRERSFSTLEFFRQHQDDLTPSGLAFHQSQWDSSVRSIFHNLLGQSQVC